MDEPQKGEAQDVGFVQSCVDDVRYLGTPDAWGFTGVEYVSMLRQASGSSVVWGSTSRACSHMALLL